MSPRLSAVAVRRSLRLYCFGGGRWIPQVGFGFPNTGRDTQERIISPHRTGVGMASFRKLPPRPMEFHCRGPQRLCGDSDMRFSGGAG